MIFLKLQGLLVLAALLSFMSLTETEVVKSITDCPQFFLQNSPPNIPGILENKHILDQNRYKPICQTFNNAVRFVTLYDTKNKIPVFSAYKYIGNKTGNRNDTWMFEPQLENSNGNKNMEKAHGSYKFQAGPDDYNNNQGFDRGHLLPNSYGYDHTVRNSTFTLTNIVPQVLGFNRGSWRVMEKNVKGILDNNCTTNSQIEGFVVIGAQPSNTFLNNKINIPSLLWSAFCCYSSTQGKWLAGAHWGYNVDNTTTNNATLQQLYNLIGGGFNVFPQTPCPLQYNRKRPRSSP